MRFFLHSVRWTALTYEAAISRNVGAVAELFDISCFIVNPMFETLPDIAIAAWEGTTEKLSTLDVINDLRKPLGAAALGTLKSLG